MEHETQTDEQVSSNPGAWDGDASDKESEKPSSKLVETQEDKNKKFKSLKIRTISTIAILAAFVTFLYLGHVPCLFMLFFLQCMVVKEFFAIARNVEQDRKLPGFRTQQWYFLLVSCFYLYGRFIKNNLLVELSTLRLSAKLFSWMLKRHTMVSYSLYMAGFVSFVLSLKRGMYRYQFSQIAWTHTIIVMVIVPSSFLVSNMFEGFFWLLLPCSLVVANDICAYLAGFFFGRTPLIKLSPKKTWEGFVGGAICTVLVAYLLSSLLARHKWMICPRRDLSFGSLDCEVREEYKMRRYTWADLDESVPDPVIELCHMLLRQLPAGLADLLRSMSFRALPVQLHAMVLALFASVIAPFGGFCASGFKRAFKMKDFGDTIPGHGGVTDRFDCQVIMAMFAYVYYWTYISSAELSVGEVLDEALKLSDEQQLELFGKLGNLLVGENLLPGEVMDYIGPLTSQGNNSFNHS